MNQALPVFYNLQVATNCRHMQLKPAFRTFPPRMRKRKILGKLFLPSRAPTVTRITHYSMTSAMSKHSRKFLRRDLRSTPYKTHQVLHMKFNNFHNDNKKLCLLIPQFITESTGI
jgi:hypothetical protein